MNNNIRKSNLSVSIIVPVYNEEDYFPLCLESLSLLDYPRDKFEVVVVDNGSTDRSRKIAEELSKKIPSLHIDYFPDGNIGEVRNRGIELSSGEVLAFVDADCVVPVNWLEVALNRLVGNERLAVVGGNFLYREDPTWLERAWALDKGECVDSVKSLATGSFIVKRSVLNIIGVFNSEIVAGEDTELSSRIIQNGFELELNSGCNVIHLGYPSNVSGFVRRQIWQTSDYLVTRNDRFDRTFVLTMLFLSLNVTALSVTFVSILLGGLTFLSTFFIPFISAVFRFRQSKEMFSVFLFIKILGVQYLYFVGRSVGLSVSFFRAVLGKYTSS